jgi:hypothetical protein
MSDQVFVNGRAFSRSSCQLKMEGEEFFGFDTIEFGQSRERGIKYGSGKSAGPRARTGGRYKAKELVFGFQLDTAAAVKKSLARRASDGKSYGNPDVLWTLNVEEPGLEPQFYEFLNATLDDEATSVEDSTEGTVEKQTFNPMRIKQNGLSLYDQSEEAGQ